MISTNLYGSTIYGLTMTDVLNVLYDIVLEAQTASRDLEHGDPAIDGFQSIEDMAKAAIEELAGEP